MSLAHKQILILILIMISLVHCTNNSRKFNEPDDKVVQLLENLQDPQGREVIVVAHRGDWRNAPENSLQAIQNCIDMGVDMVELDVRKTKDNHLVVIHDKTLHRTTSGSGLVAEWNLDSLKTLFLKNGAGRITHHKIPTLEEALLLTKGEILVNLDKSYPYFESIYKILQKTETIDQVILKGSDKTLKEVKERFGDRFSEILYMPVIKLEKPNAVPMLETYMTELKPVAMEFIFSDYNEAIISRFSEIKKSGSRIWVNALWASLNSGYEDDLAVEHTDSIYGWYLEKGVNIIQTDRPKLLLEYLRDKNRHQ